MAFVDATAQGKGYRGYFESSRLKATDVGRIHDTLVESVATNDGKTVYTPIEIDNGVPVKIGDFTGEDLQQIHATIAGVGDKIAVVGTDPVVKNAASRAGEAPIYFTNPAGKLSRTYEVLNDSQEIFAVASYQFTAASQANIKVGAYVVTDGNGMWVAQAAAPGNTYGFIGKVHSLVPDTVGNFTLVRIQCVQNIQK